MSVAEAKDKVYDAFWMTVQAGVDEYFGLSPVTFDDLINTKLPEAAIDRLILEVQAEMPCCKNDVFCCHEGRRDEYCGPFCPSCTARMKLKETADAT